MQTIMTPDMGRIIARRVVTGIDLEVKNAEGETIASVVTSFAEAWELFKALGEELDA
ncbi:hypothetical protein [Streptomyces sp. MJM1172]|uniref:hypothetical protein n=1 Tax=Streptomyces sp. MJM1172 TaxID=1703926 RepID=UPI000A93C6CA|nr:hypothetical protein [Streptomyces sp. MJM1172]